MSWPRYVPATIPCPIPRGPHPPKRSRSYGQALLEKSLMLARIGLSGSDIQYGAERVNLREPDSALRFTVREDIIDYTSKKNGADLKAISVR